MNALMNLTVLFLCARLRKRKVIIWRLIVSSIAGATMGTAGILPYPFIPVYIKLIFVTIMASYLMIVIMWGIRPLKKQLVDCIWLYITSVICAGILLLFENRIPIILSAALMIVITGYGIPLLQQLAKQKKLLYEVTLIRGEQCIKGKGFVDTGNHLREPLGGKPVVIVERNLLQTIFFDIYDIDQNDLQARLFYLPYSSLGNEHDHMIGIEVPQMLIKQEDELSSYEKVICASYNGSISKDKSVNILLPAELIID